MQPSTRLAAVFAIAFLLCRCTFADNAIYGWGANDYGQLGLGVLDNPVREPVEVSFYSNLASVSDIQLTASYHIAALSDGTVYVSGNNFYGCLGLNLTNPTGNNTYTPDPTQNTALTNCKVTASKRHANALCGTKAYGWGNWGGNVIGATIGIWPKVHQATNGPSSVSSINVVLDGTFVTASGGGIYSAGNGTNGKLGLGDALNHGKFSPVSFFSTNAIDTLFSSQSDHICATATNYSLFCWGNNDQGQLGLGTAGGYSALPQVVPGIDEGEYIISQVAYGLEHTVALSCGGRVLVWGSRQYGVIGDGVISNLSQPVVTEVTSLSASNIVEVVAGANSNFARSSDGAWYTWGAGYGGVLATTSDFNVLLPQANNLLQNLGINHIVSGASSTSAFGWNVPNVFTTTQNCPTLVDECLSPNNCATSYSVCLDTDRSYKCACQPGFQGDGYEPPNGIGCADVDECALHTDQCDTNAQCTNTIGSYLCVCGTSYHGNGYWVNATAQNIPLPGQGCILNVDECLNSSLNDCSMWANCTDTIWAYNCTCAEGFTGDGVHCRDINECAAAISPCGGNSVCANTNGSFYCTCNQGFGSANGDGTNCTDINECHTETDNCAANATCTNTVGSYVCSCDTGFIGNGTQCTNVNATSASGVSGSSTSSSSTSSNVTSTSATNGLPNPTTSTTGGSSTTSEGSEGTTGFPTAGTGGNTLEVNTIANSDTISPGSTSTTGDSGPGFLQNAATASGSDTTEKKILVGVFVGFIGLVIIAVGVVIVVVVRRRKRQNTWL